MMKTSLTADMDTLTDRVVALGRRVEEALERAVQALFQNDSLLAKAIIEADEEIDQEEVRIQEKCLQILEQQHLTGASLRRVVAMLKINDGLERIGDLAENIAKVVIRVANWERFKRVMGCRELAEKARSMLHRSLQAVVQQDVALATQVIRDDDELDALEKKILVLIEHELDVCPENSSPLMKLEHVTRQLERVGDLATNVAEEVVYMVNGQIVRHNKALLEKWADESGEMPGYRKIL
jgi:phosphate transport system protein